VFLGFLSFIFLHCRYMKKATHKQNHVMRGLYSRRGADVSHHTTPLHSWTLCNRTTARQCRSGRAMDDWVGWCEAAMWLLNNTTTGPQTQTQHYVIVPRGTGESDNLEGWLQKTSLQNKNRDRKSLGTVTSELMWVGERQRVTSRA